MEKVLLAPDYIFESSWEVCNKVGGIYTVLSTRANTLQQTHPDRVFFVGPDLWKGHDNPLFTEDTELLPLWVQTARAKDKLAVRVGRWEIPGRPIAILVDFAPFFTQKNEIYASMWEQFGVDSLHAYGDYDEASMFSYAAGRVVESFYRHSLSAADKVVYQAHEWMTGMGLLYLSRAVPQIATIFTTHATSIGRSIAGNHKPLYDYLHAYNGDQMAEELNMQSKHSVEKQTAHRADCFTTVSEITDKECTQLLEKSADVILMNGFEDRIVPEGTILSGKRKRARALLLKIANNLLGSRMDDSTLLVGTSGRYEFKNKGIDILLESLASLNRCDYLPNPVLAVITVPGWVNMPREDLNARLRVRKYFETPLPHPNITHWLHNMEHDCILSTLNRLGLTNEPHHKVKVLFIPCYLDGQDGIVNKHYYDLLPGLDVSIYPSYYEPWGYTPLESLAFRVPTVTTDLAGFGRWIQSLEIPNDIEYGTEVLHRTDSNQEEVINNIVNLLKNYMTKTEKETKDVRRRASALSERASWKHFITYYFQAYDHALRKAMQRQAKA